MIVRNLEEARKTDRLVKATTGTWDSTRLVLAEDGGGFSFHITRIFEGTETHIHYKHHYEAVYCIEGEGEELWAATRQSEKFCAQPHQEFLLLDVPVASTPYQQFHCWR